MSAYSFQPELWQKPKKPRRTTIEKTETHEEGRTSSLLTDILTIIGFAILFIIILWGFVHLVSLIASSLSSNRSAPTIEVTAPAQATSGQPVTISWTYAPGVARQLRIFVPMPERTFL